MGRLLRLVGKEAVLEVVWTPRTPLLLGGMVGLGGQKPLHQMRALRGARLEGLGLTPCPASLRGRGAEAVAQTFPETGVLAGPEVSEAGVEVVGRAVLDLPVVAAGPAGLAVQS